MLTGARTCPIVIYVLIFTCDSDYPVSWTLDLIPDFKIKKGADLLFGGWGVGREESGKGKEGKILSRLHAEEANEGLHYTTLRS